MMTIDSIKMWEMHPFPVINENLFVEAFKITFSKVPSSFQKPQWAFWEKG